MATFRSLGDWIRYYRTEGFRVGECKCVACAKVWNAAVFPEKIAYQLRCPYCGHEAANNSTQSSNHFTEFPHEHPKHE